jgi:hypothetical protein
MGVGTDSPGARQPPWTRGAVASLSIALAIAVAAAVVAVYFAEAYYEKLTRVSTCPIGLENESCNSSLPPSVGLSLVQLGKGQQVNGTYLYRFVVSPEPPSALNASSLTVTVYNASTRAPLAPSNVTLAYPNGTPFAYYQESGANWTTTATGTIFEVSILTIASGTNLSGEQLGYWTSASAQVVGLGIA